MNLKTKQKGFTLVELLIVIVVIAILAAISIVAYTGIQNRAREAAVSSKESQAKKKLEMYKVEHEAYPADQSAFDTIIGQNPGDEYYTTYSSTPPHSTYSISTSSGASVALTCPTNFIVVPGNSTYGTSDFCVMKYEAKNVGGTATSQAAGTPWVSVSQSSARTAAEGACGGCTLITEAQWTTIAANAMSVPGNWVSGTVGTGSMYRGHSDGNPGSNLEASSSDSDNYVNTGNSAPSEQRRTLTLTNGEVIWDFAGNVWEWTDATITGGQPGLPGESAYASKDYTNGSLQWNSLPTTSRPTGTLYPRSQGVGGLNSNTGESTSRGFIRGGYRSAGSESGVWALNLDRAPTNPSASIGFRATK